MSGYKRLFKECSEKIPVIRSQFVASKDVLEDVCIAERIIDWLTVILEFILSIEILLNVKKMNSLNAVNYKNYKTNGSQQR